MRVVVPFAVRDPKTRLATILTPEERTAFAAAMLSDVLGKIRSTGHEPEVVATDSIDVDATVIVDDRPLDRAVNSQLGDASRPVAIVMADLAIATEASLTRLFETDADVVIAPGRGGGTNALVVRHEDFRVDYHGGSFLDHRSIAEKLGASMAVVDSFRLAIDVDEPSDLAEVMIHGEGEAADWLRNAGFVLDRSSGRVTVERD